MVMSNKKIIVYRLLEESPVFPIVPLTAKRNWMNQTKDKFAYKCLPLTIANQYGYAVLSPADFTIDWWGGSSGESVDFEITSDDEHMANYFHHYFGEGTFTIHLDFILKTPEGFSTYIRGVPNETKKGITSLDAVVETDWLPFTFTYNFLITEPGSYTFKKNEPLFTFFPIERNTVEKFSIQEDRIETDQVFFKDFQDYEKARTKAIDAMPNDKKTRFQLFYRDGVKASGEKVKIKDHITNLIFGGKRGNIK
jgi:hypothetical protein